MSAGSAGIRNRGKKGQVCFLGSSITDRRLHTFKRIMTSFTWGTPAYKLPIKTTYKRLVDKILKCSNRQQGFWQQRASLLSNISAHRDTRPRSYMLCFKFKSYRTFLKTDACFWFTNKTKLKSCEMSWVFPLPEKQQLNPGWSQINAHWPGSCWEQE